MTNLWEAVEHNEQLEQKLEEIVEHLNQSKRRGYKMNFNVSEKLKKIDKQITSLLEEQNMKVTIIPDQDVALVKDFIAALDKVAKEMELLDEDEYSGTVLSVKLKRVYDEYKDRVMPSSSFESFIDYYSYLQTKKEEEKKEIANKEYFSKLESIKKDNETKLKELYEQYKEVLGFSFEDIKKQYLNLEDK